MNTLNLSAKGCILPSLLTAFAVFAAAPATSISAPEVLQCEVNYAEAYCGYTNAVFAADTQHLADGKRAQSLLDAARCLVKLERVNEVEMLLHKAYAERKEFPVRVACSQALGELPCTGEMVKGVFTRTVQY